MRSTIRDYIGMIAVVLVAVLAFGVIGWSIEQHEQRAIPAGIVATPISPTTEPLLVDASWLKIHQLEIDHIFDVSEMRTYQAGHIPGATHIWWQDAMRLHSENYGEADQISLPSESDEIFGRLNLGINQDARIILYDAEHSLRASWMLWVLMLNGYTNVSVLDGGLPAWIGAGGEISTEPPASIIADSNITPVWLDELEIRREPLLNSLDTSSLRLIDTRDSDDLVNSVNNTVPFGSIPGSISVPTTTVLHADGTFKSQAELTQIFTQVGLKHDDVIVVYSLFPSDSGTVWLALRLAGYDQAVIYREGYAGWAQDSTLPRSAPGTPFPTASPTPETASTPASRPSVSPTPSEEVTDLS